MKHTTLLATLLTLALLSHAALAQQPPTPTLPPEEVNLAAAANGGKVVFATNFYDDNWKPENLIDGKLYTFDPKTGQEQGSYGWASRSWQLAYPGVLSGQRVGVGVQKEEIVLAFKNEQPQTIGSLVIYPQSADPYGLSRGARLIEVQVSTKEKDGPWQSLGMVEIEQQPKANKFPITPPATVRYVKLVVLANWGSDRWASLGEVEIFPPGPIASQIGGSAIGAGAPTVYVPPAASSAEEIARQMLQLLQSNPQEFDRLITRLEQMLTVLKSARGTESSARPTGNNRRGNAPR